MDIKATKNEYVPPSTDKTLHSGAGWLGGVLATTAAAGALVTLWDSTTAAGDLLARFCVDASAPLVIFFPAEYRLRFTTGLTVRTPANTYASFILYA